MRLKRKLPLLLAVSLQILPLCRTVCTSPSAASTFAIILRWTVGAAAALGSYDSVSGASTVYIDTPTNAIGTVGTNFNFYITLGGKVGSDAGSSVYAAPLPGNFTNYTVEHLSSPLADWGVISGTPTNTMTNFLINLVALNPNYTDGSGNPILVTASLYLTVVQTSAPVMISSQPTNVITTNGQTVAFSVTATGTGPLTYQWFKGDTNIYNHIAGATNWTYSFKAINTNTASNNSGNYLVRITGAAGMVPSALANLTVNTASLGITSPPTNLIVNVGDAASFNVAATGTAPISYQWYKNATNKITGATNNTFSIANAQLTNAGNYTVVVTNSTGGALTSSIATLTVNGPSAPTLQILALKGNQFLFSFVPVVGLTNTVETNGIAGTNGWTALTNIPPPASASSITVTDTISGDARFYRVLFVP